MFERVLPIGSIVRLKGGNKKLMIIGYCKRGKNNPDEIFDYAACLYPNGFMSAEQTIIFNHDNIERIYALGYQNEERFAFEEQLREAIDKVKPFEK
ncbi:MAG: DUF4176 domain-containing protein [Lachnospiraceae bacterium]